MGVEGALRGLGTAITVCVVALCLSWTAVVVLVWVNYGWLWTLIPLSPFGLLAVGWVVDLWERRERRKWLKELKAGG